MPPRRLRSLTGEKIRHRGPVWTALAELTLDTVLQASDHARIAKALRAADLSAEKGERILLTEVLPIFGANALSVAGEWTPWTEEEVRNLMLDADQWRHAWFVRCSLRASGLRRAIVRDYRTHVAPQI